MKQLATAAFLMALTVPIAAHAQWFAQAGAPDVFGNRTVNAAGANPNGDGLAIQCNQKDSLELAYVFPVTPTEMDQLSSGSGLPVTLLLKIDSAPVQKFDATLQSWNNDHAAFVVSERSYPLVQIIKAIGGAQKTIAVGAEFGGNQQSDNFGVIGSTAAMATVVKGCDLDAIKPDQPAGTGDQTGSGNSQ